MTTSTGASQPAQNTELKTARHPRTESRGGGAKGNPNKEFPTGGQDEESDGRAHLISVFGMFNSRALVEMPISMAKQLLGDVSKAAPTYVIDGVLLDIDAVRERDESLANSGLAATALSLAFEIANPFNSATSKSMCARALLDALAELRELCPPERKANALDALNRKRIERLTGEPATEN